MRAVGDGGMPHLRDLEAALALDEEAEFPIVGCPHARGDRR